MIFIYSRKIQCLLLFCWLAIMAILYLNLRESFDFQDDFAEAPIEEAVVGKIPEQEPKKTSPLLPAPAFAPLPIQAPSSEQTQPIQKTQTKSQIDRKKTANNRFLGMELAQSEVSPQDTLSLDIDYVPAKNKPFSLDTIKTYHFADQPVFVIEFGEPWVFEAKSENYENILPQVEKIQLLVSKSKYMRLLVYTETMEMAKNTQFHAELTENGLKGEIIVSQY